MAKYELNSAEERYQPGSGDRVLANKLGITDEEEMEALESGLLLMLYEQLLSKVSCQRRWLLSTSVGGIANGWGMCTTGRGGYVMPT